MRTLLLPCLLFSLFSTTALAASTVTCHCFQDRSYDALRPLAADAYFLATAQNSLYAAITDVTKQEVVRAKMGGADGAELWVCWYLAKAGGVGQEMVAALRDEGLGWRLLVEKLQVPHDRLAPEFLRELLSGVETRQLAQRVVDAVLIDRCGMDGVALRRLRSAGADDQQVIVALLLARKSGRSANIEFSGIKQGGKSWSGRLAASGITAKNIETEVRGLIVNKRGHQLPTSARAVRRR